MNEELLPRIPDSIEPYRGYKALNYDAGGNLYSPSRQTRWPAKERLEAACGQGEWGWVPIEGQPREMDASMDVAHARPLMVFATSAVSTAMGHPVRPRPAARPTNPLPEGWAWSWELFTHDIPAEGCGCGCYAVDEPEGCMTYLDQDKGIIVEIAMWGTLIRGHKGARGQYAYPQRVLAPRALVNEVRQVSLLYGIPILVLDPVDSEKGVCTDPVCSCGDLCRVTGMDRETPRQIITSAPVPLEQDPVTKAFIKAFLDKFTEKKTK